MSYQISTARTVTWQEFSELMEAVGWGGGYDKASFQRSYSAYPPVVCPTAQGCGIGRALMRVVEAEFPGVPVYVKAVGDAKKFFEACGYRRPASEMTVMFNKTSADTR